MSDTDNLVINFVNEHELKNLTGRLDFYDKIGVLNNLMKKA